MRAAIFLCDFTGRMAEPWAEAGYDCWCVDIQHSIRRSRVEKKGRGQINFVWGDARTWAPPVSLAIAFVAGFPFCTHDAVSGARDFSTKGGAMLRDSIEIFDACRTHARWSGAPYCIEHPVTMLTSIPHIGKPDYYFHPWHFTAFCRDDHYTKNTCLWTGNGFVMPPRAVDPTLDGIAADDRIHKAPPSDDRADMRSATPRGFARAVFEANSRISQKEAA
jgi:hypothetical protein